MKLKLRHKQFLLDETYRRVVGAGGDDAVVEGIPLDVQHRPGVSAHSRRVHVHSTCLQCVKALSINKSVALFLKFYPGSQCCAYVTSPHSSSGLELEFFHTSTFSWFSHPFQQQNDEGAATSRLGNDGDELGVDGTVVGIVRILGDLDAVVALLLLDAISEHVPKLAASDAKSHLQMHESRRA